MGRKLFFAFIGALVVRFAFLLLEPATGPVADERTWTNWAIDGLCRVHFSPLHIHMIFYPPLYPYFIAVFYSVFHTLTAVKWAQAFVSALIVPAVGLAARRAFSEATAIVAAGVAALYPELVWFSVHFWSETLFMAFLWWGFERLLAADEEKSVSQAAVAGGLFGLAILTRETVLYLLPILSLWLAWRRPRGLGRGAVFLLVSLLTVAPWTYRNYLVFNDFVPVSTAGGLNLWQGNALLSREEVYARYEQIQGRIDQYHHAVRKGLEAIWERQPYWFFEKLRDEMPNFWEADNQALVHVKRGAYGEVSPGTAWAVAAVVLGAYGLLLVFFILGLAFAPVNRAGLLLLGFLVYDNLIHVVTHGYARYRLPALPVVMVFAAAGWVALRSRPRTARRPILAAVVAVALCLSLVPSVRLNLADPAFGLVARASPRPEEHPAP